MYRKIILLALIGSLFFLGSNAALAKTKPIKANLEGAAKNSISKSVNLSLGLSDIWIHIKSHSKRIDSVQSEIEVTQVASERAGRHWYPRLLLDAKAYYTNDPGSILFSKLGERSMTGSDFNPTIMNFPDTALHEKLSLVLDMPLYEGGSRQIQHEFYQIQTTSKESQLRAIEVEEYSKLFAYYSQMILLLKKENSLVPLKELVDLTLSRYQLGQSGNQLGYSGLLGLKNIRNRIQGELELIQAQKQGIYSYFKENAELAPGWVPLDKEVTQVLGNLDQLVLENDSFSVQSMKQMADGLETVAQAEKARFLPRVGAFADQSFYNNHETNFANSQTVGMYVQWELFGATNFGAHKQAVAQAASLRKQSEAEKIRQKTEFEKNKITVSALKKEIQLADESLKFLEEQSEISRKLFNSGMINVLQLIEVYSRRVDVIVARSTMEENILKSQSEIINYFPFEVK